MMWRSLGFHKRKFILNISLIKGRETQEAPQNSKRLCNSPCPGVVALVLASIGGKTFRRGSQCSSYFRLKLQFPQALSVDFVWRSILNSFNCHQLSFIYCRHSGNCLEFLPLGALWSPALIKHLLSRLRLDNGRSIGTGRQAWEKAPAKLCFWHNNVSTEFKAVQQCGCVCSCQQLILNWYAWPKDTESLFCPLHARERYAIAYALKIHERMHAGCLHQSQVRADWEAWRKLVLSTPWGGDTWLGMRRLWIKPPRLGNCGRRACGSVLMWSPNI